LFTLGKSLIGLYIGSTALGSSYGAAGALLIVLTWIYYSAQIFLLGAEFTKVYASNFGSHQDKPLVDKVNGQPAKPARVKTPSDVDVLAERLEKLKRG